jgi:O-succinylbenzoate synthase
VSLPVTPAELLDAAVVVSVPLRVRFRGVEHREAVLLRGPAGWAEFAPFREYADLEAARWLAAAVEAGWSPWPAPVREVVPVNATVPAVAPDRVAPILDRFPGCRTAKVKVAERGQSLTDDLARVSAVRDHLGADGLIRVDANGAWDLAQATDALAALAAYGLEYAEQPVADVGDLARLRVALARGGTDVLVAADESIRRAEDPLRVAREHAADLVVVKVAPLGGVSRALQVVAECGLPAVVSSALDTSVGIAAGVALAAALPELRHACGLGTAALLAGDLVADPLVPVDGTLTVARAALARQGVLDELVEEHRADPATTAWWRHRLERAVALLT